MRNLKVKYLLLNELLFVTQLKAVQRFCLWIETKHGLIHTRGRHSVIIISVKRIPDVEASQYVPKKSFCFTEST